MKFQPETFESYDDHTLVLAMKFVFQFIKRLKGNVFKFLPEVGMVLTGGFPKLVLTAEFTGDSDEEVQKKAAKKMLEMGGGLSGLLGNLGR